MSMLITGSLFFFSRYVFPLTPDRHFQINFLIITAQTRNVYRVKPLVCVTSDMKRTFLQKNCMDSVRKAGTAKEHILHFIQIL